jgi:hypothetical protein
MHYRFYSPHLSHFMSVDPIGGNEANSQSWNGYNFVLARPLKYVDPYGLAEIDSCETSGSDEEEIRWQGSVDVIEDDPGPSFDPMTGVQGLGNLVSGGTLHLTLGSSFNTMTRTGATPCASAPGTGPEGRWRRRWGGLRLRT